MWDQVATAQLDHAKPAAEAVASEHPVAGAVAGLAFTTTQTAAAAAALSWMLIEWWRHGKPTTLGMASGIVAGLVAITPGAGYVRPLWALFIGALASVVCYGAVQLKGRLGYDDTLDAFGVHGIGGIYGALVTGLFCSIGPGGAALVGGLTQLGKQALGAAAAIAYALFGTLAIGLVLKHTLGLRVSEQEERAGLDLSIHGESGYHLDL